ncbi:MAG: mechanosensitive ion channel domain-containing protein [Pseudomonadota bacterium]
MDSEEALSGSVEQVGKYWELIQELVATWGLKVVAALAILIIGRWVVKAIRAALRRAMDKRGVEPTISRFLINLAYIGLMVFVVVAALGQLGIQTTSFIAVVGAAGLAIGLALQGSLSNFAAGFMLVAFRPFKVGDVVEGGGVTGKVEGIHIFSTELRTPDNKVVIVPNGKIFDDAIINYSAQPQRRVDLTVGVSYDADLAQVKSILEELVAADSRILKDPAHQIAVAELADNSVNLVVRAWVDTPDYWGVKFDLTEAVKVRFDAEGIGIPYPQRDVHVYEHKVA